MTDNNPFEAMMKMSQDWAKSMNVDMEAFTPKGFENLWPTMPAEAMESAQFFARQISRSSLPGRSSTIAGSLSKGPLIIQKDPSSIRPELPFSRMRPT